MPQPALPHPRLSWPAPPSQRPAGQSGPAPQGAVSEAWGLTARLPPPLLGCGCPRESPSPFVCGDRGAGLGRGCGLWSGGQTHDQEFSDRGPRPHGHPVASSLGATLTPSSPVLLRRRLSLGKLLTKRAAWGRGCGPRPGTGPLSAPPAPRCPRGWGQPPGRVKLGKGKQGRVSPLMRGPESCQTHRPEGGCGRQGLGRGWGAVLRGGSVSAGEGGKFWRGRW